MIEVINTGIAPSSGPINDCVRAGNHVWLVVLAEDPKTGIITDGNIELQTRKALSHTRSVPQWWSRNCWPGG